MTVLSVVTPVVANRTAQVEYALLLYLGLVKIVHSLVSRVAESTEHSGILLHVKHCIP